MTTNPIDTSGTGDTTVKNPIDTLGPCQSPDNPLIGRSGFVLDGGGYANAIFAFDSTTVVASFETLFNPNGTILILRGPIELTTGKSANVTMEVAYPTIDQANKSYDWRPDDTTNPSGIRLAIEMDGATRVLKPSIGTTKVVTVKIGSFPYRGSFCGFMKDSASGVQVAVKSGEYYVD